MRTVEIVPINGFTFIAANHDAITAIAPMNQATSLESLYSVTTLEAFGVVAVVQQQTGGDRLSDFAGLSRRYPGLAIPMMIFILSLAGVPPLAGFFGKFYMFSELLRGGTPGAGLLWLVILAIALSAVSLYYYLQVLKQIFVVPEPAPTSAAVPAPIAQQVVLGILAAGIVLLGCFPEWLIHKITGL